MKPTNEEIRDIYVEKQKQASSKFTAVQAAYSSLKEEPSDSLLYQISILGCKVMMANLKGHINKCKNQIKKYATIDNIEGTPR